LTNRSRRQQKELTKALEQEKLRKRLAELDAEIARLQAQ
jgi:hypothetical protein